MNITPWLNSFWVHLEELRKRLFKCAFLFVLTLLVCFDAADSILEILIKPAGRLVFTTPGGGFSALMSISLAMAFIICAPYFIFHLWSFISLGLKPQERRYVYVYAPLTFLFFLLGVCFAYVVALPMTYRFLMGFQSPNLVPMISVDNYLSFVANMVLVFGVTFELPLVLAFLAHIGIATPEFLRQKRRHAIVGIFIIAAILTPPDVFSQLILALPLVVLYEVGIIFVRLAYRPPKT